MLSRIVRFDLTAQAFEQARTGPIFIVFILMFPAVFMRALRWFYILRRKSVDVTIGSMFRVTFIGMALNLFLPASGGDIAKSYYGWQSEGHKEAMLASAVADKVIALFSLCLLGIICGLLIGEYLVVWITAAITVPLVLLLFVHWPFPWRVLSRLVKKVLKKDLDAEKLSSTFRMDWITMLGCVGISLIGWLFTNLMYYFAAIAFNPGADVLYVFTVAPLINVMRIIPITISGLGTADALIIYLFANMGLARAEALAASMVINIFLIALPGVIGTFFILFNRKKRRPSAGTVSEQ